MVTSRGSAVFHDEADGLRDGPGTELELRYHHAGAWAARFISQFTTGYGDYTKEREELFKNLTLEEVVAQIRSERKHKEER
ncbi:MAG: hypothetical protein ACE5G0_16965 [Rhodothermales bacterium]